jgi:gamma-glutamylcyclotransferase (GGCT)/AIG2-like uncharacterized protein YtfP
MSELFFVYGTLKRGQCRESMWPRTPIRILEGRTRGTLLDLVKFPGLILDEGGWVSGELWEIQDQDLIATKQVLDEIEGYQYGRANNHYDRQRVQVVCVDQEVEAWTYIYLHSQGSEPRVPATPGDPPVANWTA